MIPILYENNEALFTSNGLGRLNDCISCIVTEERNGLYECDFEYPMDGTNFDLIQVGRIIGVTHDDSGDVQPFDIVGYSKPIDGIVQFHAVHISYRLSGQTVWSSSINSLAAALTMLRNVSGTRFQYWTDKTSTGYMAAADGLPKSVRSVLGGVEGSILDTYGGEYEFDKWTVKLHKARGEYKDFSIRYGVNMLDYNEDYDCQDAFTSCIPYWTDGEDKVIGSVVSSGQTLPSGRRNCVPLDLSDKFENKPTTAQVEAEAASYMSSNSTYLPTQNIHVEFVRLQDMPEYEGFSNLLECKLCDTINVVFPDYNRSGEFKIVKTEWNALQNKYESMELGDLSISLAEALGITDSMEKAGSPVNVPSYLGNIVSDTYTTAAANTWEYTGKSFQVPANHVYLVRITAGWSSGRPTGIGVHTATSLGSYTAPSYNYESSAIGSNLTMLLGAGTYYVWAKRAGTGSNNYTVTAFDFDIS